jgi:anaerobic magnesium-protoporphyrin IX monomethyl ester cyclase
MSTLVPNAISILSAVLKAGGFKNIDLFDTTFYGSKEDSKDENRVKTGQVQPFSFNEKGIKLKQSDMFQDFVKKIEQFNPDVIYASIVEDTFPIFKKFMELIESRKITVLAGGISPTSAPEIVARLSYVDFVCLGEGEGAILDLSNALEEGKDPSDILNLWVKKNEAIVAKNPIRSALDVNSLPVQDLSIFEDFTLHRPMMGGIYRMAPVETQRGCPYACTFCNSPEKNVLYDDQNAGDFFRKRSMENVHTELKELIEKYRIEYIFFITDTFLAMSESEFDEFCEMYSEFKLPFFMNTRPETITEYRAKKLKEINWSRVNIGVEHGNQKYRANVVGRNYKNEFAVNAFNLMYDAGISTVANSIIGYPDETRELVFDTIALARKLKCDDLNAFTFAPYHGTSLRLLCESKNYINPDALAHIYTNDSMLTMPTLSKSEIRGLMKTFVLYVRLPKSYWEEIKLAEQETKEGLAKYDELMTLYDSSKDN